MEMHAAILRESLAPTDSDAPPMCASPAERSGLDAAGDDSSVAHAHPLLEVRALTVSRGAAIVTSATMSTGVDARSHQRRPIEYLAIMALTVAIVAPPKTVSPLVFAYAALGAAQTIMLHLASRRTARDRFGTHG